jgi:hypothetical protein
MLLSETGGMRYQYRTVPYHAVPGRDGTRKKGSRAVRYGTVWISRGTVRYAVSDGYTALPCHREKSFDNDFQ